MSAGVATARLGVALTMLAACAAARVEPARNPYTADQVERLLLGAVPPEKIVADARRECVAFEITPAHAAAFSRAGAPAWFADSIGSTCRASALPAHDAPESSTP